MKAFIYTKANRDAVRRGLKSQTRRLVKHLSIEDYPDSCDLWGCGAYSRGFGAYFVSSDGDPGSRKVWVEPRYSVGDICYMREPFRFHVGLDGYTPKEIACGLHPGQRGDIDYPDDGFQPRLIGRTRSSLHLPAAFARTFKRVTEVRCERLQDISDKDCFAEGICFDMRLAGYTYPGAPEGQVWGTPRQAYEAEIVALHGRDVWDGNAWVWVYAFELCDREGK